MKRQIRAILCYAVVILLLFDFFSIATYAAKDYTNELDALPGPYQGYSSINDLEEKRLNGTRLTLMNLENEQCVNYAITRSKEKVFGRSVSYGVYIDSAKNIAKYFYDCGYSETGSLKDFVITAKDGTDYYIRAYTDDDGMHITSNSMVCFNSDSTFTDNVTHGHVVFVEEVVELDGVRYVYYTEGGDNMSSWGIPQRMTFAEFYDNDKNRAGYCGTVVFSLACSHETFGSDGLCTGCHREWMNNKDDNAPCQKGVYQVKSGVTAYLRVHPYESSNAEHGEPATAISEGELIQVTGAVENGLGHIWYHAVYHGNEGYVYSKRLEFLSETMSTLSINPTAYPKGTHTQGQSFTLKGTVTSNYTITSFEGAICNSAGVYKRASMQPNKNKIVIEGSDVDKGLPFGSLPAGSYYLHYIAADSSGICIDWSSDWFTVTGGGSHTHDKGTWLFYEAAHPHYNCYRCSICGETWRDTSSSNYVDSCTECNPPANPGLSINPTTAPSGTLTEGNSFSLQGTVTSNYPVTYFEGVVYDSANQIFISAGCYPNSYSVDIRSSNVNQNLPFGSLTTGSYYLVYNAVDSSGASTSWNSGWFTVSGGGTLPVQPTVATAQSSYNTGDTISIWWNATAGNDYYWINVFRDGTLIVDQSMYQTTSLDLQDAQAGSYTVYVSANNSAGTSGSSACYFQVVDPSHMLDVNGILNGQSNWNVSGYGTFNVYINGSLYRAGCYDFCEYFPVGTAYEIRDITPNYGCSYDGIDSGYRSGVIGSEDTSVWLRFSTNDYNRITETPNAYYNGNNGHTYLYYSTPVTWYFAEGFCASVGGHLVTLSDVSENQFVKDCLGGNFAWIGLTDAESENAWYWITGEPYQFSDWYPGEPNNASSIVECEESYVHYNSVAWNDINCCEQYGFVCEIEDPALILNINGVIDGELKDGLEGCGTADVYINGQRVAEGWGDYYMAWPKGTTFEIRNIRPAAGYSYDGIFSGSRTGTFGTHDPLVCFSFSKNDFSRITETPTQSHFNGHTYLYYSSPVTWYFAKEYCESLGGHLITITSEQENQLAKQITDNNNVWLGATDAGSEGTWYWITGESFEYSDWLELQPDNAPNEASGEENYAELNPTWTTQQGWNDVRGCATITSSQEGLFFAIVNLVGQDGSRKQRGIATGFPRKGQKAQSEPEDTRNSGGFGGAVHQLRQQHEIL